MCDILFMLVHVFNVTRVTSNQDSKERRIYTTTKERDSIVFHSFIHLMRIHGVESCFAPGVHHVRTKSQQQSKYFSKGKKEREDIFPQSPSFSPFCETDTTFDKFLFFFKYRLLLPFSTHLFTLYKDHILHPS